MNSGSFSCCILCAIKKCGLQTLMPPIVILLTGFILSACSMDASIGFLSKTNPQLSQKASLMEITPSSSQGVFTSGGYEVQASVSYYYGKPEVKTPQGYTVQSSIQPTLFKE